MTTLTSNFKLIKAYKKYSIDYKNCTVQQQRIDLYHKWLQEVIDTKEYSVTSYNYQNLAVYCELCISETTANEYLCCRKCLFPIIDDLNGHYKLTSQQQLNVFALLSVCYWEEKLNTTNTNKELEENTKLIWKHRLRIAWLSIKRNFVCFIANTSICFQCNKNNLHISQSNAYNSKIQNFNVNYFCQDCLFPLFDKLLFIQ